MHCYECGEELKDYDSIYHIGEEEYICEECRDAYYVYCEDCSELVPNGHIVAVNNDHRYVCSTCADDYYICDHCDGLFDADYIAVDTHYITLCQRCYEDYYVTCETCGEVCYVDDAEYIGYYYYCRSCADDHSISCILFYSNKPNPIFFGDTEAGYGVELEIDNGNDKRDAAWDIQAAGDGHIYLKEDGSLSPIGMEIVTHPATLYYHVNRFPWTEICETALSYGYRSHDTDTCGLHIHASRSLFGDTETEQDLTIAKIILLIDRWYNTKIVKFARRDLSKMQQWADKPNADIRPGDDEGAAVHKCKKSANGRYKALNLCNTNTVEFRFFRGTLNRNTIIASIQWADTIIQYCRNTPLKDLWSSSWDDIFSNTEHAELSDYLKQHNLYKVKGRK